LSQWTGLGKTPLVAVPTLFPDFTDQELYDKGFSMIILANHPMRAAVQAAANSQAAPIVSAVTVLTSLSGPDLSELGIDRSPSEQVGRLARVATKAGVGALVCSAQETQMLREQLGDEVVLVTPGIRPTGSAEGDQVRVVTPARAVEAGASYVVVGRPITESEDPSSAAKSIAEALAG
ncbi:MAG: orotidine-5'-phosphate decarboxylase, partial [Actinobacteria bacterium]|nr:orotidine-5'-phosphate decarboxylase [Actinomycetota bacterium]